MLVTWAAITFSSILAIVILFQISLASGAPWGKLSMGGKFPGKYPPKMRVVAIIISFILVFIGIIVLIRAGFFLERYMDISEIAIWFVLGFFVVGTFLNSITTSKWERRIWAPVNAILIICTLIIALN